MPTSSPCAFREAVIDAARRLHARMHQYASRLLAGDEGLAHDAVQHAFMQLCAVAPEKRPDNLDAWLFRVCRNRAVDLQRQGNRFRTGQDEVVGGHIDGQKSTEETVNQIELGQLLQSRLTQLPAPQREAVDLWANGFRYAEVARIMDRKETNVRVLVHRGITRLRSDPAIRNWLQSEYEYEARENPSQDGRPARLLTK